MDLDLSYYLGITRGGAVAVVISTVVLYFAFGGLLRLWGQRLYSSPRSVDLAVATVLGAIVGRSTIGHIPTLAGGLIALGTLAALELFFRFLRRLPIPKLRRPQTPSARGVVLAVGGKVRADTMRTYGLTMPVLWSALRQAGVSHPSQVALAVLEPRGRISVLRTGQPIHPSALTGVRGAHTVLEQLREAGELRTAPLSADEHGGPSGGSGRVPTPEAPDSGEAQGTS
ncbi:DUF421 domain-containing protein [Ornithinimicrobium avium]|uniref:DUF421 domain-containing protein n=1 Tax=Ornithinimicrobium avium TaxID=2283195 RepID=A0A345NJQ0_9MICO|nr:YetF domain-containing protein [Ornithinimicrobium avium]AXH95258.1 DUF421 domain-containing protein [Ornithinimicrobium avium]